MARRAVKPPPAEPPPAASPDFGPDIRLQERAKRVSKRAPKPPASDAAKRRAAAAQVDDDPMRLVIKEFRADPSSGSARLIRGGRVRDPLRMMLASKHITRRQWNGVEGFRDDCALAAGARLDQPDQSGVRCGYSNTNWPTEAQLGAFGRVQRTMARLDEDERFLLVWSTLQHRPLSEFTKARGMRNEDGGPLLRRVLDFIARRHGTHA